MNQVTGCIAIETNISRSNLGSGKAIKLDFHVAGEILGACGMVPRTILAGYITMGVEREYRKKRGREKKMRYEGARLGKGRRGVKVGRVVGASPQSKPARAAGNHCYTL